MLIFQYMPTESTRFGMSPTFQESMRKEKEKKTKAESRTLEAEMEKRASTPKFEGPQIFTREQFGKESGAWLKKLNQTQGELMEEIQKRAYMKGENVDALEAQAALLKSWSDRVWALSLENAHQGLTDPEGIMTVDRELLTVVEGDPMAAVEAAMQRAAFPEQLDASARGLESAVAERAARENREKQMSREIAGMRETMDTLEERMRVIQDMRREIDEHEDKLIESGEFSVEKLTPIDIERTELEKLHSRFFDEISKVMKNFSKLLDTYETFQSDNPFAKAS